LEISELFSFEEIISGMFRLRRKARVRKELEEYCKMDTFAEVRIGGGTNLTSPPTAK